MKNFTVLCSLFARSPTLLSCLSLYSVDSFWALICCCFVNYCLLYWFCWLISLIRLSAFLLLLSLFPGLWTLYWKRWPFQAKTLLVRIVGNLFWCKYTMIVVYCQKYLFQKRFCMFPAIKIAHFIGNKSIRSTRFRINKNAWKVTKTENREQRTVRKVK